MLILWIPEQLLELCHYLMSKELGVQINQLHAFSILHSASRGGYKKNQEIQHNSHHQDGFTNHTELNYTPY